MNGYDRPRYPRVLFGTNTHKQIGDLMKSFKVTKVLLVTDPGVYNLGYVKKITDILEDNGIEYEIFKDVMPNPDDVVSLKVGKMIKEGDYNGVIGFGGGSPMDVAKSASLVAGIPEEIEDMHEYRRGGPKARDDWKRPYPLVTITTTSGTAAEVTASTALTDTKTGLKFSFGNAAVASDVAIVDPIFTVGMPKVPTVNGAMDAMAHAIEHGIGVYKNDYTTGMYMMCLEKIWKWLPVALAEPDNLEAREQLSFAAHNSLAHGGVPQSHAIAHAVGALYHMVHGPACAVCLPTCIRWHAEFSQKEIARIADIIGVPVTGDAHIDADRVARRLHQFYVDCGVPTLQEYLAQNGYTDTAEEFAEKASPFTLDDWKSKLFVPPIHEDMEACLKIHRMIYEDN